MKIETIVNFHQVKSVAQALRLARQLRLVGFQVEFVRIYSPNSWYVFWGQ